MSAPELCERTWVERREGRLLASEVVETREWVERDRRRRRPGKDEPVRDVAAAGSDVPGNVEAVTGDDHAAASLEFAQDPCHSLFGPLRGAAGQAGPRPKRRREVGE